MRKKNFENLIIRMTKSHVPKCLIETSGLSNIVAGLGRQSKLRSLMRIDGINSIFTLALVEIYIRTLLSEGR